MEKNPDVTKPRDGEHILLVFPGPSLYQASTVLCSWTRHFTLTVPLSTQGYMDTSEFNAGGNTAMD